MSDAMDFMLAARRCEMQGLQTLEVTCAMVAGVSRLVHALQRERGFSNVHLGSDDERFRAGLDELTADCKVQEQAVREDLARMDLESGCGADKARLFNRIAFVLHCLDGLPRLRQKIRCKALSPLESTQAFSRPIGGLLSVVFEAADTAVDPQVTRALVALFNFMQGKELAGQERATGVAGFGAGYFDAAQLERLRYLEDGQLRCFASFEEYAEPKLHKAWQALCSEPLVREIVRLRQVAARSSAASPITAALGEVWFELTSRRIDGMKQIEDLLTDGLEQMCRRKIDQARADLDNHRALLKRLASLDQSLDHHGARLFNVQATELDSAPTDNLGSQVHRSMLDVLHAQSLRLQALNDELEAARRSLSERKLIERAKAALMREHGLSDDDAYRMLQNAAMERGQRLADVAQTILTYTDLLRGKPQPRRS